MKRLFSSEFTNISNATALYCSLELCASQCVSLQPPQPPTSPFPLCFFFSFLHACRIVYVAWVWLRAFRSWPPVAGTCVHHYLIKVLQWIQPGSVSGLGYCLGSVTGSALCAPCFVVCCALMRGLIKPDISFFVGGLHCHHLSNKFICF